tara:strand:+ start:4743 stop:5240 length:498 start_codon:yes stop_codon:yes gene_type:complete
MFEQAVYQDPELYTIRLQEYFQKKSSTLGWNQEFIDDLKESVQLAYEDNYSIFSFDTTITKDMGIQVLNAFIRISAIYTDNKPEQIKNYQKVLTTLGQLTQTSHVVSQTTGLGGLQNVVKEQVEEMSKKQEEARNEALDKYLPWIIGGAAAYFILPKLLQTYVRK